MPNVDTKLREAGGRLFEFLTIRLFELLLPNHRIVWQPIVPEILIQPDVGVYAKETGQLVALGLSGHATTKKSAGTKADRNIEELFEIKESFCPKILAFSFIWHSPNGWATGQLKRMDQAFDYNFVSFRDCGGEWDSIVDGIVALSNQMKGQSEEKCREIVAASTIPQRVLPYVAPLKSVIENQSEKNTQLWNLVRNAYEVKEYPQINIKNSVKLSLQPLVWLPEKYIHTVLNGKDIPQNEETEAFARLGGGVPYLAKKIRITPSIVELSRSFDVEHIKSMLTHMQSAEGIKYMLDSLGSIDSLTRRIERTTCAIRQKKLAQLCNEAIKPDDPDYIERCWPFDVCTAWIKIKIDPRFGMMDAQRETIGDTQTDFMWDLIVRYTEGNFSLLDDNQIASICTYFENALSSVMPISAKELSDNLLVESRKKKDLNPLSWMIAEELTAQGITYVGFPTPGYTFQCLFTQLAGIGMPSGMTVYKFRAEIKGITTIIHVLSSYSSTHKDVEYAAKARLARYKCENNIFSRVNDFLLVYVLDGEWSNRHITMFERAGAEVVSVESFSTWLTHKSAKE